MLAQPGSWLPWVGAVVLVAANWSNVTGTWRGHWGTNVVTWTIWAGLAWVALLAQIQLGAQVGVALLIPVTAVSTVVAAGAWWVRRQVERGLRPPRAVGEQPWQRWINRVCAAGAGLAFVALLASTTGLVGTSSREALVLTIITDGIAAIPTAFSAGQDPRGQPLPCFTGGVAAALCTLAAAPTWSFDQVGYAAYLSIACSAVAIIIVLGRARLRARELSSPAPTADPPPQPELRVPGGVQPAAVRSRPETVWVPASVLTAALDPAAARSADELYRAGRRDGWPDRAAGWRPDAAGYGATPSTGVFPGDWAGHDPGWPAASMPNGRAR